MSLGSIGRCPGSGRKTKITQEVLVIVNSKMREDNETTAVWLKSYRTCRERSGIIVWRPKALAMLDFFPHIGRY